MERQRDLSHLAEMQQHKHQLTGGIQQQPQRQEQQLQDVNTITGSGGVTEKQQQQQPDQQHDFLFNSGKGMYHHPANKKVGTLLAYQAVPILISSDTSYSLFMNILYFYSLVTQDD